MNREKTGILTVFNLQIWPAALNKLPLVLDIFNVSIYVAFSKKIAQTQICVSIEMCIK